jgi:hypothetical protein
MAAEMLVLMCIFRVGGLAFPLDWKAMGPAPVCRWQPG